MQIHRNTWTLDVLNGIIEEKKETFQHSSHHSFSSMSQRNFRFLLFFTHDSGIDKVYCQNKKIFSQLIENRGGSDQLAEAEKSLKYVLSLTGNGYIQADTGPFGLQTAIASVIVYDSLTPVEHKKLSDLKKNEIIVLAKVKLRPQHLTVPIPPFNTQCLEDISTLFGHLINEQKRMRTSQFWKAGFLTVGTAGIGALSKMWAEGTLDQNLAKLNLSSEKITKHQKRAESKNKAIRQNQRTRDVLERLQQQNQDSVAGHHEVFETSAPLRPKWAPRKLQFDPLRREKLKRPKLRPWVERDDLVKRGGLARAGPRGKAAIQKKAFAPKKTKKPRSVTEVLAQKKRFGMANFSEPEFFDEDDGFQKFGDHVLPSDDDFDDETDFGDQETTSPLGGNLGKKPGPPGQKHPQTFRSQRKKKNFQGFGS
jgi:hypothetical protein